AASEGLRVLLRHVVLVRVDLAAAAGRPGRGARLPGDEPALQEGELAVAVPDPPPPRRAVLAAAGRAHALAPPALPQGARSARSGRGPARRRGGVGGGLVARGARPGPAPDT